MIVYAMLLWAQLGCVVAGHGVCVFKMSVVLRLSISDMLRSVTRIGWNDRVRNVQARNILLGSVQKLFYLSLSSLIDFVVRVW